MNEVKKYRKTDPDRCNWDCEIAHPPGKHPTFPDDYTRCICGHVAAHHNRNSGCKWRGCGCPSFLERGGK